MDSRKELRCPECRVLVTVPLDELPPNVLLSRILEGMKNAANQAPSSVNSSTSPVHSANNSGNLETNTGVNNQATITTNIIERTPGDGISTVPENNSSSSPQHQAHVKHKTPHARAIYDFNSKESGDLSFKKTDIIILKKRIDQNWYIGELNSRTGSFPINHVQVCHKSSYNWMTHLFVVY